MSQDEILCSKFARICQTFAFFIFVGLVDFIITSIVMVFDATFNVMVLYIISLLYFTFSLGLLWLAIKRMNFRGKDMGSLQIMGYIIGTMIVIAIGVPIFLGYIFSMI